MEKTYRVLKLIILVLFLAAVLLGARLLYQSLQDKVQLVGLVPQSTVEPAQSPDSGAVPPEETQPETQPRKQVPDFTVYDLDGNAYRLSDFRGKPVILNFWASWCGPCKSEMPDFDEKYGEYGDQIHFLMVNLTDGMQETQEKGSGYVQEQGFAFPVYYDLDISAAMAYSVTSVPVTYFVDSEGYLEAWYPGAMPADILQQGIDILLSAD